MSITKKFGDSMSVTDILNKLGTTTKEHSDTLSTATKDHLGKIQKSYSEKFLGLTPKEIEKTYTESLI